MYANGGLEAEGCIGEGVTVIGFCLIIQKVASFERVSFVYPARILPGLFEYPQISRCRYGMDRDIGYLGSNRVSVFAEIQ